MVFELSESEKKEDFVQEETQIDLSSIDKSISEPEVVKYVNLLFKEAINNHSPVLYIEPKGELLHIQYWKQEKLHEIAAPPKHLNKGIISRIKNMACMDIQTEKVSEGGLINLQLESREYRLLVRSTITSAGESLYIFIIKATPSTPRTMDAFPEFFERMGDKEFVKYPLPEIWQCRRPGKK